MDCFIIGSVAYKNDDFYHARNWLKAGYDNTQIPEEKEYFVELLINSTIKVIWNCIKTFLSVIKKKFIF